MKRQKLLGKGSLRVTYSEIEHAVWHDLIKQQLPLIKKFACKEYLDGFELLNLSVNRIPNLLEISERLTDQTSWVLKAVDGLVSNREFFYMLSNKTYPVVTKIRTREEIDFYTDESPDIFHEIFGHCPLLTNEQYAESVWLLGKYSLKYDDETLTKLAKIFWATYEFGLIKSETEIKIFGAGILPSKKEIETVIESPYIEKLPFEPRSDITASLQGNIVQSTYYTVPSLETLYHMVFYDLDKYLLEGR